VTILALFKDFYIENQDSIFLFKFFQFKRILINIFFINTKISLLILGIRSFPLEQTDEVLKSIAGYITEQLQRIVLKFIF